MHRLRKVSSNRGCAITGIFGVRVYYGERLCSVAVLCAYSRRLICQRTDHGSRVRAVGYGFPKTIPMEVPMMRFGRHRTCPVTRQGVGFVVKWAPGPIVRRVSLVAVVVVGSVLGVGAGGVGAVSEGFSDVEGAGVHRSAVVGLAARGVFEGTECGPGEFCPTDAVQRWVMAVWLVRLLDGADPVGGGVVAVRGCGRVAVVGALCGASR